MSSGFILEYIYLFRGLHCKTGHYSIDHDVEPGTLQKKRARKLDAYARSMQSGIERFPAGFDRNLAAGQEELRQAILNYFDAPAAAWGEYAWHLGHIIKDKETLGALVHLSPEEVAGLEAAERENIPIHITPYYLSLFNRLGRTLHDRVLRAQVLPTELYCKHVAASRSCGANNDFMDEGSTSPIDGITRRYPHIVILKPFDSCPQICVYCQRNWEIKALEEAQFSREKMQRAIDWIARHRHIQEVLVTGGDPLTLSDAILGWLFEKLAAIPHIERIRIGTRTLVTLPQRITPELIKMLCTYHSWGRREVAFMTHVEHPAEVTEAVIEAVSRIKSAGTNIYNQQVFTYYNSRRYETAALRKVLKRAGIDPYYSFNTKGKGETEDFRVPMARIQQERKEEARILPGLARTDESVFNVPRLGKSHLRAWQDHEPIMILPDGSRIYRFYPWESRLTLEDDYLYTDVSVYDYLRRLKLDHEDVDAYASIWYYY